MAAVDVDVVRGLVEGALQRARSDAAQSDDRERSRAFVEALHEALWVHYRAEPDVIRRAEPDVIVMSRSCTSERDRKRRACLIFRGEDRAVLREAVVPQI
jgi:hypothetical protein